MLTTMLNLIDNIPSYKAKLKGQAQEMQVFTAQKTN